jgi:hypothetical protein
MPMSRCMRVDEVVRNLDEREKAICFGHDKTGPESKSSCAYGTSFKIVTSSTGSTVINIGSVRGINI